LSNSSDLTKRILQALEQDLHKTGDITSQSIFSPLERSKAVLIAKQNGVIAGMETAKLVCRCVDSKLRLKPAATDGTSVFS